MEITWLQAPRLHEDGEANGDVWYIYGMEINPADGTAEFWTDPDEVGIVHDTGEIVIGSYYTEAQGRLLMAAFLASLG